MDFFTVEAVTWLGLVRYHVLFAIDVGMAVNPGGPWMDPMVRNLVDAVDGFPLMGHRDRLGGLFGFYHREAA